MKRLNRYYRRSRIAEKKFREIIKYFALDLTANRTAELTGLKLAFRSVDLVGKCYVFNVGGNKYRVIARIHFNRQMVFIRFVLTHKEYDKDKWKSDC